MLVVAANWAISDGTLVSHPRRRQADWLAAVHRAVIRAGWRRDGIYLPVADLDIVLAGDSFDWLTSTAWSPGVRPWHDGLRAEETRRRVMVGSLRRGRRLLAGLRGWCRDGLPVPDADRHGRPRPRLERRIPVRVTLLAGDRDRDLEGAADLAGRHGLAVGTSWTDGWVSIRHGSATDPMCDEQDFRMDCATGGGDAAVGRRPSLAESLAVGLVSRFGVEVRSLPDAWPGPRSLIGALVAASPADMTSLVEAWVMDAVRGGQVTVAAAAAVSDCWRRAVVAWLREARAEQPRCGLAFDGLAAVADVLTSPRRHPAASATVSSSGCGHQGGPWRSGGVGMNVGHPLREGRPFVILGHGFPSGAEPAGNAEGCRGVLSLAGTVGGPGPAAVCCHREQDVLRVDLLEEPMVATSVAVMRAEPEVSDRGGLVVDAA